MKTPGRNGKGDGWVMVLEGSPSPLKDKEKERRERKRQSNPNAPTAYRSTRAHSPSLSSGPASSYLNMSTSMSGRTPQPRLSGGNSSTSTIRAVNNSRPTSPTMLPMSTSTYGMKKSTGLHANGVNSLGQSVKRSSMTTSTNNSPSLSASRIRSTTTSHPPLSTADLLGRQDAKALPQLPNVTLRSSRSPSGNAVSNLLSKSRIGRPASGRRSAGGDSDLDIQDLRPRSGSMFGK